jgi:hypothetical protein
MNVVVIIMTMVVTSQFGPNYAANKNFGIVSKLLGIIPSETFETCAYYTQQYQTGPVTTSAGFPKPYSLFKGVSGLMNGVFAYGGATLFNELMAEMRRP